MSLLGSKYKDECYTRRLYNSGSNLLFLFGLSGHVLGLVAYIKHRNDERGFYYQILVEIGRIFEIFAFTTSDLLFYHGARLAGTQNVVAMVKRGSRKTTPSCGSLPTSIQC